MREAGLQKVINGEAVVEQREQGRRWARRLLPATAEPVDQYVELGRERTDKIFVVLASSATSGIRA